MHAANDSQGSRGPWIRVSLRATKRLDDPDHRDAPSTQHTSAECMNTNWKERFPDHNIVFRFGVRVTMSLFVIGEILYGLWCSVIFRFLFGQSLLTQLNAVARREGDKLREY